MENIKAFIMVRDERGRNMNKSKANDISQGFSLRIFLPNGTPDILKIIEKSNWKGQMPLV